MLGKGLIVFEKEGISACKVELRKMYGPKCSKTIAEYELTCQEIMCAQEGLMPPTRKRSGSVKGRLAYNHKKRRDWISKESTLSPTVGTDTIIMTVLVDTHERRDVTKSDVLNVCMHTYAPVKNAGERLIMKIRGKLVD